MLLLNKEQKDEECTSLCSHDIRRGKLGKLATEEDVYGWNCIVLYNPFNPELV
jgi:hypothetical protein